MPNFASVYEQVIEELTIQQKFAAMEGASVVLNTPCVLGPVGVGKTSLAKMVANHFELPLVHVNMGDNSDPTDASGFPHPGRTHTTEKGIPYAEWVLNHQMALACSSPVLLFVDDSDKAPLHVQNALLALCGERKIREFLLHPGTLVMLAGNRVGDDIGANALSESIKTRISIIELDVSYPDFAEFAETTQRIHPSLVGYLGYRKEHLHKVIEKANRFPTPRGYEEASMHFFHFPEKRWKDALERKVGKEVASDFWAWWTIIKKVDIDAILYKGQMPVIADEKDEAKVQYAAIYALVMHLNEKGVKPNMVGIPVFIDKLANEMRVAMLVQLKMKRRAEMSEHFATATAALMKNVTRSTKSKMKDGTT